MIKLQNILLVSITETFYRRNFYIGFNHVHELNNNTNDLVNITFILNVLK